jgi:hypothetical protein
MSKIQRHVQMLCLQTASWFFAITNALAWKVIVGGIRMKARSSGHNPWSGILRIIARDRQSVRTYEALHWVICLVMDLSRLYLCAC